MAGRRPGGPPVRLHPQPPAAHGGATRLPIDLSASLNPLGPSPAALTAARAAGLGRYPEPDARSLAVAAAARHGLPPACVVPVPGASWGLWLAIVALAGDGAACLGLGPCFGEYERLARTAGAAWREARCPAPDQAWREADVAAELSGPCDVCVLANPANPAGTRLEAGGLRRLCAAHPAVRFVVDEAFAGFAPPGTSLLDGRPPPDNAVVVRSLTKELALPGLRMGYLVAPEPVAAALAGVLPAWPLSAPALAAAAAGLADPEHLAAGAALAARHLGALAAALRSGGLRPLPTCANYLLCEAPGLAERLAGRGVAVRDCASFGLPGFVRIAAPRPDDLAAVLEAIRG
jgi:histidinol-phosphate/aromatic aminotransferase/cobyric acid decarboxylase-like protein